MPSSIVVDHVSLDFPIYHGDARSLKKLALSAAGRFARDKQQRVVVQALRDISFKIESGERLALIGRNGAGKTTLLRCLAGIYEPVSGDVTVQGELSALLDVGLGMNADMTGRENILLRGRYLGMDGEQIGRMEEDIVGFAELGEFLDLPVKFYSSGMMLRLAFAMATSSQPNILLMDEWLLAGDAGFLEKAHARIDTFVSGADIVVISTHSESIIRKWATRVLYLDQGRIKHDGDPDEVLAHYHGDVGAPVETVPV